MLKEKVKQVKDFVAEHKKEIAVGLCVTVGGVIIYKITKKEPKLDTIIKSNERGTIIGEITKQLEAPVLDVGTIDDMWVDKFGTTLILNDITVNDLGKVGEEFLKIDGINKDTCVTAVVGLLDKVESVTEF